MQDGELQQPRPYADQVAGIVRRRILTGEYSLGERLSEAEIAAALGISRSPVREGLRKLTDEGLLELVPRRGTFVATFTATQVRELLEVREALDVLAARLAAKNAGVDQIKQIEKSIELVTRSHKDESLLLRGDTDFHTQILRASGNSLLFERGRDIHTLLRLFRFRSGEATGRAEQATLEHREILKAIKLRDPKSVERLVIDHLRKAERKILSELEDIAGHVPGAGVKNVSY